MRNTVLANVDCGPGVIALLANTERTNSPALASACRLRFILVPTRQRRALRVFSELAVSHVIIRVVKRCFEFQEGAPLRLYSTAKTKDEVEGRLLLDVVVRKGATVLELLAGKDETLLIRRDALLVLNLGLNL